MLPIEEGLKLIRSNGLLEKWTDRDILNLIRNSIVNNGCTYTMTDGKLDGLVLGTWSENKESIYIHTIVGEYKPFLEYLKKNFPNCQNILGYRKKKQKLISFKRLLRKI